MEKTLLRGKLNKSSKGEDPKDLYIEGIMSTPVVDLENEIIGRESYPNAINEIKSRNNNGRPIPIFVEHRRKEWSLPVGSLVDAKDTEDGLWFKAKIIGGPAGSYLDTVQRLIKAGALYGCSIGGDALKSQMMYDAARQNHVKKITQMDLRELSLTGMPVNQGSSFKIAKSLSGKDKVKQSEWQKEVSSLYKSLNSAIDKEMAESKISKSINSLNSITKSLEDTVEQGNNVDDVDILDKIKGALTDLADLLGIQDLVNPSAGEEMGELEGGGMDDMAMDMGEEPMEESMPEESNALPEEAMEEETPMEEDPMEETPMEENPMEEQPVEEMMEEPVEEEPMEDVEEQIEDEEELDEDMEEQAEDVEELDEDMEELDEDLEEGAGEEEIAEDEEEIVEGQEEIEENAAEISEGIEDVEENAEENFEDMGDDLMSDNVDDIEEKLDKIIQLLSKKKGKAMNKKKSKAEKENLIGGDTMGKEKTPKAEKTEKAVQDGQAIEKSSDIVGVRGEQATTPEGSDVIESQHPHDANSTGNGQENFDIGVADNPNGSQVEVGQKEHNRSDANTAGNDDIVIAENPDGSNVGMSHHPHSVFKCSNEKCGQEFAKSEEYDPNFCAICGTELDKYVYATEEQIQVLKDLEILQDTPAENTGYAVSEFSEADGSFVKDKMKEVTDKRGNDIPEQSNDRNIQFGGKDVDGYGHDGHDYNASGSFKNFIEGANNVYANKYSDGSKAYHGPQSMPASKPYVGYTVKSQEENKIEKAETPQVEGDLSDETKASIEKSVMGGLLEHTNALMGKIDNLEKTVQEMKDRPVRKSVQTSEEIRKSKQDSEQAANKVWANAFGFGKKEN